MALGGFYEVAHANASFDSDDEARETAEAVMETLGESISRGEAVDLAEQLPSGLEDPLLDASADDEQPESPPLDEFYDRVAERAGLDSGEARPKAQAVGVAIHELAADEVEDALDQLLPDYDELFHPARDVQRDPFATTIRARLDLETDSDAAAVAEAVLETLGERLPRGEAEDLAVYLPADAADWLVVDDPAAATDWSEPEFLTELEARTPADEVPAREQAEAVLGRVAELATDREVDRALAQLPEAYEPLFGRS